MTRLLEEQETQTAPLAALGMGGKGAERRWAPPRTWAGMVSERGEGVRAGQQEQEDSRSRSEYKKDRWAVE